MRFALICLLISLAAVGQEAPPASGGGARFFFGVSPQIISSGLAEHSKVALALQGLVDNGQWMIGGEFRVGGVRGPTGFFDGAVRLDRFLQSRGDTFYLGTHFGVLDEVDGEFYGGQGWFTGAQVGYVLGRDQRVGRVALELLLSIPLFGERAGKPGDYVYPFGALALRLFL